MKDLLLVVDRKDKIIDRRTKNECHQNPGILHRAFSIFIFNRQTKLLLQKRSKLKLLWPLFWSNTCCSHPKNGQNLEVLGKKRLVEELGFSCQLTYLDKINYRFCFGNIGCEREITHVLVGQFDGRVKPNPEEVAEINWVSLQDLKKDFKKNPNIYTPWLKLIVESLILPREKLS